MRSYLRRSTDIVYGNETSMAASTEKSSKTTMKTMKTNGPFLPCKTGGCLIYKTYLNILLYLNHYH